MLVVHAGSYDDPYDLAGEVQFIEEAKNSSIVKLLNTGLEVATGVFIHVLRSGTEVDEDWTEAALECLEEPQVGMVSPLLLETADPTKIVAFGVKYAIGGKRKVVGAGKRLSPRITKNVHVAGPTLSAGFYRADALHAVGGFDPAMGDELADLDVALSLEALGCECKFCPECSVRFTDPSPSRRATFRSGRSAERLFWRHQPRQGGKLALAIHPFTVLAATLAEIPHLNALTQLFGRANASLELGSAKRYEKKLQEAVARFYGDNEEILPMTAQSKSPQCNSLPLRRAA